MPEIDEQTTETPEQPDTEAEATEEQPDEAATEEAGKDDESKDKDTETELPDWAQKELKKARGDAANYRTKLREMEQRFENAKSQEEYEAALSELREENEKQARALLVENVALKYKLPDELAARLQGATREELEADAKALAKFAPSEDGEDPDLSGGLDPFDRDTEPTDPGELARRVNRGRRKR